MDHYVLYMPTEFERFKLNSLSDRGRQSEPCQSGQLEPMEWRFPFASFCLSIDNSSASLHLRIQMEMKTTTKDSSEIFFFDIINWEKCGNYIKEFPLPVATILLQAAITRWNWIRILSNVAPNESPEFFQQSSCKLFSKYAKEFGRDR